MNIANFCGPLCENQSNKCIGILNNPLCEDRDCELNIDSKCNDITTMLWDVPDGMYSCSNAIYSCKITDYIF